MREILFRGKRLDDGEWVEGYYVHFQDFIRNRESHSITDGFGDSMPEPNGYSFCASWEDIDPDTLGRYTGITDKNGKKIFEGDIIEDCNNRIGYVAWLPQECGYVVVWEKSDSRLGHRNRGSGYYHDTTISVIGNIHDNPDLMKGGEK